MIGYENRQPTEGINVTAEHPLGLFAKLLFGAAVLVVALVIFSQFAGSFLAKRIPFSFEERVVARTGFEFADADASPAMSAYLNGLAARVVAQMDLPEGMSVRVHYDPADTFNAFATVGGNLIFYRGLLERIPHENALATIMAHEIAHVLYRDPLAGLGGGVASTLALAMLTGNAGTGTAAKVLNNAGMVTGMQFTRRMERAADAKAIDAIGRLYGHVDGADALFAAIAEKKLETRGESKLPGWIERFTSTHPLDADRVASIGRLASEAGVPIEGPITPLPEGYRRWLQESGRETSGDDEESGDE